MNNIVWYHGTCDNCGRKQILILHYGYITQPDKDFRICMDCIRKNKKMIDNGWQSFLTTQD